MRFIRLVLVSGLILSGIWGTQALADKSGSAYKLELKNPKRIKEFDDPKEAYMRSLYGMGVVDCWTVDVSGNLKCIEVFDAPHSIPEAPSGFGFARATVKYIEANYYLTDVDGVKLPLGTHKSVVMARPYQTRGIYSDGDRDYRVLPTQAQIAAAYPPEALAEGTSSTVLAYCKIKDDQGHVTCPETIFSSTPEMGFEAATRTLLETHAIAARYYMFEPNANGSKRKVYPLYQIGELRQVFISFKVKP